MRGAGLHLTAVHSATDIGVAAQVLALVEAVLTAATSTFSVSRVATALLAETSAVALTLLTERVLVLTRTPQLIAVAPTPAATAPIAIAVLGQDRDRGDEEDSRSGCSKETMAHQDARWRKLRTVTQ